MKEIIAIIRPERTEQTKAALDAIGVNGITFINVLGRGRQKGTIRMPDPEGTLRREVGVQIMQQRGMIQNADDPRYHVPVEKELELGFLPKKMLLLVVQDDDVRKVTKTLADTNRSDRHGDGKVFVCPVADAVRIRTGEHGDRALS